ncbi:MAG: RidA family protein [Actinomycetota bacterium]|nr:RidA family protein [Actinomycetota bacterium]
MAKQQVRVTNSAPARGAYSQAICAGDFVCVTGTAPVNPETGTITATTVAGQTEQVIDNIEAALTAAAGGLGDVVKSTMHLLDTETLAEIDECMVPRPPNGRHECVHPRAAGPAVWTASDDSLVPGRPFPQRVFPDIDLRPEALYVDDGTVLRRRVAQRCWICAYTSSPRSWGG